MSSTNYIPLVSEQPTKAIMHMDPNYRQVSDTKKSAHCCIDAAEIQLQRPKCHLCKPLKRFISPVAYSLLVLLGLLAIICLLNGHLSGWWALGELLPQGPLSEGAQIGMQWSSKGYFLDTYLGPGLIVGSAVFGTGLVFACMCWYQYRNYGKVISVY